MPEAVPLRETPLSRDLHNSARKRTAPRDAFELALSKWEAGERVEIAALAQELGVGRATLFRWVGSRELLLGEVIWSVLNATLQHVLSTSGGKGAEYVSNVTYRLMELLLQSEALRQFIAQDAEYALRLLTSKNSTVQARAVKIVVDTLRKIAEADRRGFAIEVDALAFTIVRIVEACIYSDQITGRRPDIRTASEAIRILVAARAPEAPSKPTKKRGTSGRNI